MSRSKPALDGATGSFHGGRFWEAVGVDLATPERVDGIVPADVLDAWFNPAPEILRKLGEHSGFLARTSPPADSAGLIAAISKARGISADCLLAGGGASDLLFASLPHLLPSGSRGMILDPSYGEYAHIIERVAGAQLRRFPLQRSEDFRTDGKRLATAVSHESITLAAIVNPNSPTGAYWAAAQVCKFLDRVSPQTVVVIDETYLDYLPDGESLEAEATRRSNVIVIKSLSKIYGLSGLRVGYLATNARRRRDLAKWIPPWAVSLPAQLAAILAFESHDYYQQRWRETGELRDELSARLARIPGVKVYPGCANFLLIEINQSAAQVGERMRESGVYIRNCDSMSDQFEDRFLRVAVRTRAENARVLQALAGATCRDLLPV